LRQAGYRLGVISNFDERLYKILENMNIDGYFDFVQIPSSCQGFAKPSEEIFHATRMLASGQSCNDSSTLEASQFLHVGDSVELDYRAARNTGFKALLLCHNKEELEKLNERDEIRRDGHYATDLVQLKDKILSTF
jgi:putative hydrolase of the HAD superfamily